MNNCVDIKVVNMNGMECKVLQYVDDTTIILDGYREVTCSQASIPYSSKSVLWRRSVYQLIGAIFTKTTESDFERVDKHGNANVTCVP